MTDSESPGTWEGDEERDTPEQAGLFGAALSIALATLLIASNEGGISPGKAARPAQT